jgi:hypothetical protein
MKTGAQTDIALMRRRVLWACAGVSIFPLATLALIPGAQNRVEQHLIIVGALAGLLVVALACAFWSWRLYILEGRGKSIPAPVTIGWVWRELGGGFGTVAPALLSGTIAVLGIVWLYSVYFI